MNLCFLFILVSLLCGFLDSIGAQERAALWFPVDEEEGTYFQPKYDMYKYYYGDGNHIEKVKSDNYVDSSNFEKDEPLVKNKDRRWIRSREEIMFPSESRQGYNFYNNLNKNTQGEKEPYEGNFEIHEDPTANIPKYWQGEPVEVYNQNLKNEEQVEREIKQDRLEKVNKGKSLETIFGHQGIFSHNPWQNFNGHHHDFGFPQIPRPVRQNDQMLPRPVQRPSMDRNPVLDLDFGRDDSFVFGNRRTTTRRTTTRRTTTPRPTRPTTGTTSTNEPTTTTLSDCERRCQSTQEFNPVCATDFTNYNNPGKLKCAQRCGKDITLLHYGVCNPTTSQPDMPTSTTTRRVRGTRTPTQSSNGWF